MQIISRLQVDLLLIFYNFSDQYGNVDVELAAKYAKETLNLDLPKRPFKLEQKQLDLMMKNAIIPDTSSLLGAFTRRG